MKSENLLLIGGGALAVIWAMNSSKGIQTATSGVGQGVAEVGGLLGTTAQESSKLLREVTTETNRTTRNIFEMINYPMEAANKIRTAATDKAKELIDNVGLSQEAYLKKQPIVQNPAQGTRKNLMLAASRGKETVPLIVKNPVTNKTTTTNVNVKASRQKILKK